MPSVQTLLVFAALSVGLAATPGPNMLYLVSRALAQGTGRGWCRWWAASSAR